MSEGLYHLRKTSPLFEVEGIYTVYQTQFEKDYKFKGEVHNFWELVYVKEGYIGITANNKIFEMQKGQIVFHKPGEFHSIWASRESRPKVFILSFQVEQKMMALENKCLDVSPAASVLLNQLMQITLELRTMFDGVSQSNQFSYTKEPSYGLDHRIKNYLELFLLEMSSQKGEGLLMSPMISIHLESYDRLISYIHTHLEESLNIDQLSANCGLSRSSIKTLFRKYAGLGAMEYVNKLKIHKAMELLEEGYSSQEIADQLAFSSPYYFSHVFKKIAGVTPTAYKQQKRMSQI